MGWIRRSQSLVVCDITGDVVIDVESGLLVLARAGNMVTLTANRVVSADSHTTVRVATLPSGFRPFTRQETATTGAASESTDGILQSDTSGAVWMHGIVAGESNRATLTYPTRDAWPTTLPGVSI